MNVPRNRRKERSKKVKRQISAAEQRLIDRRTKFSKELSRLRGEISGEYLPTRQKLRRQRLGPERELYAKIVQLERILRKNSAQIAKLRGKKRQQR